MSRMEKKAPLEWHHFDCACSHYDHTIRFMLDPEDGSLYLDVRLNPDRPWHKRVWNAVKYVFNPHGETPYGHYDCTTFQIQDLKKLENLASRARLAMSSVMALESDA